MIPSQQLKMNVCHCGGINLTYGSVTFHFGKKEFLTYATHLGRMATQISNASGFQMAGNVTDEKAKDCH